MNSTEYSKHVSVVSLIVLPSLFFLKGEIAVGLLVFLSTILAYKYLSFYKFYRDEVKNFFKVVISINLTGLIFGILAVNFPSFKVGLVFIWMILCIILVMPFKDPK